MPEELTEDQRTPRPPVARKGPGGPPTVSPYVQTFEDYLGRVIRITVTFNESTGELSDIVVFRDAGCLFTNILIGLGDDGTPDSSTRKVNVPAGTTDLTNAQVNQLKNRGLNTITEFWGYQITAGL
jgi:hypothetical protein